MSSKNNNIQTTQTSTDQVTNLLAGAANQLLPQFQMMLNTALEQQAAKYENTMKQMAEEFGHFRMNPNQPPPATDVSMARNTQQKTTTTSQSKGKKPNRPAVPISAPSAPPKKTVQSVPAKKYDTRQTQRAEAVATALKCQNFRRSQSEPLNSVCLVTTPKKNTPRGSLKNGSPSKRAPHQMMLEDYPDDFLDTKVSNIIF